MSSAMSSTTADVALVHTTAPPSNVDSAPIPIIHRRRRIVLSWVAVLAVAGASIALGASVLRSHTSSVRLDNVRTVAEHGSISAIDHRDAQVVRARHAPDQTVAEHGSINAIDHRDAVADRP